MNELNPSPPATVPLKEEVRQCARCGDASVVHVFEWEAQGGSIHDYRCQRCGAKFSLHPKVGSITFFVIGILLAWAIFPIGFAIFGWVRWKRDKNNPIVRGAPRPQMKFRDGPPRRRCGTCGQPVALKGVTRHTSRGMPTGTEYEYACGPCDKPFVIESAWGHLFGLFSTSILAMITAGLLISAEHPGWRFGGGGVGALITLFLLGQNGLRLSNRFRYPVID